MYYIVGACQVGVEHARREGRQSRRKEENINCGSLPAQIASLEPALRMVSIEDILLSVFHLGVSVDTPSRVIDIKISK